jgi:hypothetical protein
MSVPLLSVKDGRTVLLTEERDKEVLPSCIQVTKSLWAEHVAGNDYKDLRFEILTGTLMKISATLPRVYW